MKIEEYREKIKEIFENLDIIGGVVYRLSSENFTLEIGRRVLNKELKLDGIPVYSANVKEPFGYIDKSLIEDFSKPSILWGIDGDWMVNTISENIPFYPTDHAGVLRLNTDKINYRYLAYKLEKEGQKEGFSRSYRASIGQIKKLSFEIPDLTLQNEAVDKVIELEKLIKNEEENIEKISIEKNKVLERYLR
ncbi:MAG: restriction endonuclease subunit S [Gemella sp.]|nr:restriction endonuclease subunit S [Gemella sp.]